MSSTSSEMPTYPLGPTQSASTAKKGAPVETAPSAMPNSPLGRTVASMSLGSTCDRPNIFTPPRGMTGKDSSLSAISSEGVEAGASIAANGRGNVYLVWHAGRFDKEDERRVYIRYREDGKTFGAETRIDNGGGVCACCGLSAATDPDGALIVSYRAATDFVDRDITLLKSDDRRENFSSTTVHKWNIPACPVSTTSVALGPENRMLMSWETEGQVFFTHVGGKDAGKDFKIIPAPGDTNDRRKNPTVAMNRLGEVLLAWGDGPGWRSGGVVHWQVYDAEGMATETSGVGDEMPEFSVPTAVATGEGFVVVY